jgi:ParB family chromosome partitioning protein
MNATPTLEMLDPATLTMDINVRKDAALTIWNWPRCR